MSVTLTVSITWNYFAALPKSLNNFRKMKPSAVKGLHSTAHLRKEMNHVINRLYFLTDKRLDDCGCGTDFFVFMDQQIKQLR